ncbi:MAG: hypothetical protein U0T84_07670 [Chitinophagales bacterium]
MSQLRSVQTLIGSLSKAEKRHFKLYSKRINRSDEKRYLTLYHIIEANLNISDTMLKKKVSNTPLGKHLHFYKKNLFDMIMEGLLDIYRSEELLGTLRYTIRESELLMERCMYAEAEKRLIKIRKIAWHYEYFNEFIEIGCILTKLKQAYQKSKADVHQLLKENQHAIDLLSALNAIQECRIALWNQIRKLGNYSNKAEIAHIPLRLEADIVKKATKKSLLCYYYMLGIHATIQSFVYGNAKRAQHYELKQIQLFQKKAGFFKIHIDEYIKAVANYFQSTVYSGNLDVSQRTLREFRSTIGNNSASYNPHVGRKIEVVLLNMDVTILWYHGDYQSIVTFESQIRNVCTQEHYPIDINKKHHLWLVLAIAFLYVGNFEKAIEVVRDGFNEKEAARYLETYFDVLLLKWVVFYSKGEESLTKSAHQAMTYLVSRKAPHQVVFKQLLKSINFKPASSKRKGKSETMAKALASCKFLESGRAHTRIFRILQFLQDKVVASQKGK